MPGAMNRASTIPAVFVPSCEPMHSATTNNDVFGSKGAEIVQGNYGTPH